MDFDILIVLNLRSTCVISKGQILCYDNMDELLSSDLKALASLVTLNSLTAHIFLNE